MIAELVRNALAFLATVPVLLVPRRARFRAVLALARVLTPLVGGYLRRRFDNIVGGAQEETARACFRALVRMRVPFVCDFVDDMDDGVLPALRSGGVIFVTAHFPMNGIFLRWLYDQGHPPTLVRDDAEGAPIIWGTGVTMDLLHPHGNVMLQIRRKLLEGRVMMLAVDRARPDVRSIPFEGRFAPTRIATPIFTLAEKMDVPLFFFGARLAAEGLPVLTVRRIAPDAEAFAEQFRRHTSQMLP